MKNLAIIPARGGSKRIPHKNIKPFLGKPIIAYSIEAALDSGLFEDVIVSTNDRDIATIAERYGASVPFLRSDATSDDYATLSDVLNEVVNKLEQNNQSYDNLCCILATAPLVSSSDLKDAYQKLINTDCVTVYPVVAFSYPILRSLSMDNNGFVKMNWPEYTRSRSQDLKTAYHDSGTFYWHKLTQWKQGIRNAVGIDTKEIFVQDIDTEEDWALAELKYKLKNHTIDL